MASLHSYVWQGNETLWHVAGRYLAQSGYPDVSTFAEAIRAANPQILDWAAVSVQAGITIPFSTS